MKYIFSLILLASFSFGNTLVQDAFKKIQEAINKQQEAIQKQREAKTDNTKQQEAIQKQREALKKAEETKPERIYINYIPAVMNDKPILQNLYNDNIPAVINAINSGEDVNTADKTGKTLLMYAAQRDELELAELLIRRSDININAKGGYHGFTALMYAAKNGNVEIVEKLLEMIGIDVNAKVDSGSYAGHNALFLASRHGYTQVVAKLVAHNRNTAVITNTLAGTPMISAAARGEIDMIDILHESNPMLINQSASDDSHNFPLRAAIFTDQLQSAKKLVRLGADVNKKDAYGNTPLIYASHASSYDRAEIVDYLLSVSRVDLEALNNRGDTALVGAAYKGKKDIVIKLLAAGAEISNAISKVDEHIRAYRQSNIQINMSKIPNLEEIKTLLEEEQRSRAGDPNRKQSQLVNRVSDEAMGDENLAKGVLIFEVDENDIAEITTSEVSSTSKVKVRSSEYKEGNIVEIRGTDYPNKCKISDASTTCSFLVHSTFSSYIGKNSNEGNLKLDIDFKSGSNLRDNKEARCRVFRKFNRKTKPVVLTYEDGSKIKVMPILDGNCDFESNRQQLNKAHQWADIDG